MLFVENSYGNSLYFELVKERGGHTDEQLRLPIINNNIKQKYNYPILEKSEPTTFIYNVIKNMLDEHHNLNKSLNIRKKRFDWDEFKHFSAYQIYTILSLNRVIGII